MNQKIEPKGFRKNIKIKQIRYSFEGFSNTKIKYNNKNITIYKLRKYLSKKYLGQSFDLYYKELCFYTKGLSLITSYEGEKSRFVLPHEILIVNDIIIDNSDRNFSRINLLPFNKDLIKEICEYSNEVFGKTWGYDESDFKDWYEISELQDRIKQFKKKYKSYDSEEIDEIKTSVFLTRRGKPIYKKLYTRELITIYKDYLNKIILSPIEYNFLLLNLNELEFYLYLEKCIKDNYKLVTKSEYKIYYNQMYPRTKYKKAKKVVEDIFVPRPKESSAEKKKRLREEKKKLEEENLAIAKRHGFDEESFMTNRKFER